MLVNRFNNECDRSEEMPENDRNIYEELGELAKFVDEMTRAIRDMEDPVASSTDQLPQATDYLADLARVTEEGAHKVMVLTETMEENRKEMKQVLLDVQTCIANGESGQVLQEQLQSLQDRLDDDDSRLMDITVALSFQDLVAQRVKKLVAILEEVQHKLLKLVVVFGVKEKVKNPDQKGRGYEMLKQLDETTNSALKQDLVDDILGEFGFH